MNVRKIISVLMICFLISGFSACSNDNEQSNKKLKDTFDMMRVVAETNEKIGFSIKNEQLHYELKSLGEYDECEWRPSRFEITVICNYDEATNEDWYKQCAEKDIESLNTAFLNFCIKAAPKSDSANASSLWPGSCIVYDSLENFNDEYLAIKALAELDYIANVNIVYWYGTPICDGAICDVAK